MNINEFRIAHGARLSNVDTAFIFFVAEALGIDFKIHLIEKIGHFPHTTAGTIRCNSLAPLDHLIDTNIMHLAWDSNKQRFYPLLSLTHGMACPLLMNPSDDWSTGFNRSLPPQSHIIPRYRSIFYGFRITGRTTIIAPFDTELRKIAPL
jgi:hypothetical protein